MLSQSFSFSVESDGLEMISLRLLFHAIEQASGGEMVKKALGNR
jgi:hypothetical protein